MILGREAEGELVEVGAADQDRSCTREAGDNGGSCGCRWGREAGPACGRDPRLVDDVLHRDRHAGKGAGAAAGRDLGVDAFCCCDGGVAAEHREGIQVRLSGVGAVEVAGHDFHGGSIA